MTREKALELATKGYAATLPRDWHVMPHAIPPIIATLEALGLIKFDESQYVCPACMERKEPGNIVCPKCHENDPTLALRTVRGEAPEIRPPWEIDAAVCDVIEKTLYERDWPDTALARFIIDDLRKADFEIVRNTP